MNRNLMEKSWEVARCVAEIDKQLLSTGAVAAFAELADSTRLDAARSCAEIVATVHGCGVAYHRILREFGLKAAK